MCHQRRYQRQSTPPSGASRGRVRAHGSTLLEVVAAAILATMVVAPTMQLLVRSHAVSERLNVEGVLENCCNSMINEQMVRQRSAFTSGETSGVLDVPGHPAIRYRVLASTDAADGGIPDRLMTLSVEVWEDANRNQQRDDRELFRQLWTKIARGPNG